MRAANLSFFTWITAYSLVSLKIMLEKIVSTVNSIVWSPLLIILLIGAGLYHLTGENGRQLSFDDILPDTVSRRQRETEAALQRLQARYGLDFSGNLDKIFHGETLYRTVEYMRKHAP